MLCMDYRMCAGADHEIMRMVHPPALRPKVTESRSIYDDDSVTQRTIRRGGIFCMGKNIVRPWKDDCLSFMFVLFSICCCVLFEHN